MGGDLLSIDNIYLIAKIVIVFTAMILADRLTNKVIKRYTKKWNLEQHAANIIKLLLRIIIIAVGLSILLSFFGLSADWLISVSALSGAAIGFASTQTVGNFLAGLYIMISRPFMVNDYVRIGTIEGEVREITINYTKIFTPTYNIMEIPNRKVLDSAILNFSTSNNVIDYSFEVGFPHQETNDELINHCILPAIEEFYNKYKDVIPQKPDFSMARADRLGRTFLIRMFFPEKRVKKFYDLQPELLQRIISNWDTYKSQKNKEL